MGSGIASCAGFSLTGEMSLTQVEFSSSGLVPAHSQHSQSQSQALLTQPLFHKLSLPQPRREGLSSTLILNLSWVTLPWVLGRVPWDASAVSSTQTILADPVLQNCSPEGPQSSWRELEPPAMAELLWHPRAELCSWKEKQRGQNKGLN